MLGDKHTLTRASPRTDPALRKRTRSSPSRKASLLFSPSTSKVGLRFRALLHKRRYSGHGVVEILERTERRRSLHLRRLNTFLWMSQLRFEFFCGS